MRSVNELKINSFGAALSIYVAAAATLSACGNVNKADNKATGRSSAPRTVGECFLRGQADVKGERFYCPRKCDDPICQSLRTSLSRAVIELHPQWFRCRN